MFRHPTGIVVNAGGVTYVADTQNGTIRRVTATGVVTTFAGRAGEHGNVDGIGADARFGSPAWVAIDGAGVLFVSDSTQHTIRRISPDGNVTTLAGKAGESGTLDGAGASARFNAPAGLVCDSTGNLYVADTGNHSIRRIDAQGVVTTFAGGASGQADGSGSAARFNSPVGICLSTGGVLYVSDSGNYNIRQISSDGQVTTLAGPRSSADVHAGYVDGESTTARFGEPLGLALDATGTLLVADHGCGCIRTVTSGGFTSTLTRAPGEYAYPGYLDGPLATALLRAPAGLARDSNGNVYFSEDLENTIRRITPDGVVSTLAGQPGASGDRDQSDGRPLFRRPAGLATDEAGNLYVADFDNGTIRKITPEGLDMIIAGRPGQSASDPVLGENLLVHPRGVAVDRLGTVYIADTGNSVIRKLSPGGILTVFAGGFRAYGSRDGVGTEARFTDPAGIAIGGDGNLYVVEPNGRAVRKITPTGTVATIATSFLEPTGVVADARGIVYVADALANTVYRIDSPGSVRIVAGSGSAVLQGSDDGYGTAARFDGPWALALDETGSLYVAERYGCLIRKISATGSVTTLAGVPRQAGFADGFGADARFASPAGIAIGRSGLIYVSDGESHTIRLGVPSAAPSFRASPANCTVGIGTNVSLGVQVDGAPSPALHWQLSTDGGGSWGNVSDDDRYSGSATATLTIHATPLSLSGTLYRCVATSPSGTTTSASATLTVTTAISRLANISTRAYCGTGNSVTIGGFVVTGSAPKRVLIRAVGPTLTTQGIGQNEVLQDPVIEVHHGASIVAQNDNWGDNANAADITAVARTIGANALAAGDTQSSALLTTLNAGVYTFVVKGKNDTAGIVLLEVYDADTVASDTKFVDIAARAYATTGNGVAIGGFVISGNAPKRVLMRAVGPTLTTQGIGETEVLRDPLIELHHGSATAATNDDWGSNANATEIRTTAARIGATALASSDTTSSALLMTLDPGVYTFIAKGKNDTSGIVLVEVYDAD